MSADDEIAVGRHGLQVSWINVIKGVGWLLPFLVSAIVVYLHSEYVTPSQVQQSIQPLVTLPARVQSLEEFRIEVKHQVEQSTTATGMIQQDMAVIKSQQAANSDTLNRILHRLDQLADQRSR